MLKTTDGDTKGKACVWYIGSIPSTIPDQTLFLCIWPSKNEWSSRSNSCPKIPTRHFLALKRNSKTPELSELIFSICVSIGYVLLSYWRSKKHNMYNNLVTLYSSLHYISNWTLSAVFLQDFMWIRWLIFTAEDSTWPFMSTSEEEEAADLEALNASVVHAVIFWEDDFNQVTLPL